MFHPIHVYQMADNLKEEQILSQSGALGDALVIFFKCGHNGNISIMFVWILKSNMVNSECKPWNSTILESIQFTATNDGQSFSHRVKALALMALISGKAD